MSWNFTILFLNENTKLICFFSHWTLKRCELKLPQAIYNNSGMWFIRKLYKGYTRPQGYILT